MHDLYLYRRATFDICIRSSNPPKLGFLRQDIWGLFTAVNIFEP